jgi:GntR family transcriptional repressor for pyruvate dehydrogenase complex
MPTVASASTATNAELSEALGGNIDSTTAVAEVTRRLLDYFMSGSISPGDRLPPERRLALSMGVGRSAIREALAALEVLGVVNVRPGSGTYLRGTVSELLPKTLSWGILLGESQTRDLIGVRHALEVQAARLAATAITDDALQVLGDHMVTMRSHTNSFPEFVTADMRFHQLIAEAAGNAVLDGLLQTVRSLIRVWVERALNDSGHARTTCAEHAAVLEALERRDPQAAAEAMSQHMDSAAARLLTSPGEH